MRVCLLASGSKGIYIFYEWEQGINKINSLPRRFEKLPVSCYYRFPHATPQMIDILFAFFFQYFDSRQDLAFQQFQESPSSGRNIADFGEFPGAMHRHVRVSAVYDGQGV